MNGLQDLVDPTDGVKTENFAGFEENTVCETQSGSRPATAVILFGADW